VSAVHKRVVFRNRVLPYVLVAPQLAITLVFFIWPAGQALFQSLLLQDAFGLSTRFVWFENFERLFSDAYYLQAFRVTVIFSTATAALALGAALLLAVMADRVVRGAVGYKTLLMAPYAIAPVVAGVLWLFMFNPTVGIVAYILRGVGYTWNHQLNGTQALLLVVLAGAWKQISYNFLFFLAGLQAIPKAVIEAAAIDGAGPGTRFWRIVFPLLSPTTFFLVVVNLVYAFFDTFGIIHAVTAGGPAKATETLVYKVFNDGFIGLDFGSSAAQSVILMAIVIGLTVVQFRYIERRVVY
jgi:sn-glycerol 3-phosphate transport system permease protein